MTCLILTMPKGRCCSLTTTIASHPEERKISSTVARPAVCLQMGTGEANSLRLGGGMNMTNLAEAQIEDDCRLGRTSSRSELEIGLTVAK